MKKKRRAIIKAAQKAGWKGQDLESLKSWAFEEGITEFTVDGETVEITDLDEVFKVGKRLTIDIDEDDDDGEPVVNDRRANGDDDDDDDDDPMGEGAKRRGKARKSRRDEQDDDGDGWIAKLNGVGDGKKTRKGNAAERDMHAMARKMYNRKAARGETSFADGDIADLWVAKTRVEMAGSQEYPQKKRDLEVLKAAQASYDGTLGGVLMPDGFSLEIINNRPLFGTVRDYVGVYDMTRPKEFIPRFGNSVSWSKVAENQASTETNATFDGVYLESEEISGLLVVPLRLMELSPYAIADTLFEDIDNSQREYEDRAYWLGTDNWPGIQTLMGANNRHTVSGLSSLAGITPTDMLTFQAQLPDKVDRFEGEVEYFCHRSFDKQVFQRFITTASGAQHDDITDKAKSSFGGTGIKHVNVMPSGRSFASGTYYCYVGPPRRATKFGVVQNSQRFAESTQRYIEKRQWCAVASVEIAVNPHEVKNVADNSMVWGLYCTS